MRLLRLPAIYTCHCTACQRQTGDQGKAVIFTAPDWTDDERRVAVAQVMRWAGLSDAGYFTESPP